MHRRAFKSGLVLSVSALLAVVAAGAAATAPPLSADEVVAKNIAARGGLEAWRAVRSMSFSGRMEAGGKQNAELPFGMELKRPRKSRVEIDFAGDRALQVYDGQSGFKLRPFLGRRDIEPFNAEEAKAASLESDLDGPLVDYAAKGTTVELEGSDKVEGRDTYKLKLTLKGGQVRHLWIDAQTFLEAKIEGAPRRLDGKMRPVEIFYRDFRAVNGLKVPYVLESAVKGSKKTHKMTIESVTINPDLEDSRFTRAALEVAPAKERPEPAVARTPVPASGARQLEDNRSTSAQ
ncbi:MAG: outer membrane lipoprotein-sorting protein [Acidobacteriia bacterium]|nr:outer membrane lipoprotein-sorting protein [Terriglobia bacterium]